jgi:lipocalin-like protein
LEAELLGHPDHRRRAHRTIGANPKGRSVFTPNGYVAFVIVAANRKPATNDAESAALLKTLVAHTGKFTIDGDKFTTKVDISWNELFTGQDQVRFFNLQGDRLTIRTPEQASAVYPGRMSSAPLFGSANGERLRL